MNSDQFISNLSGKMETNSEETSGLIADFVGTVLEQLQNGQVVSVHGFGNFEVKTKAERRMYNPTTKDFKIIPSKLSLNFKMSNALKSRING